MKYLGIIICLFIYFQFNLAQNKIFVGANFSPSLSYVTEPEEATPGLTYSTGIDGLYFLDEHLFIKTGINFSQRSSILKDLPAMDVFLDLNGDGLITLEELLNAELVTYDITEVFQSVNLLLNLNYKFADEHKTSLVVSTGIELGYFYNTKFILDYSNGKQTIINWKYKKLMGEFNFGLGLYKPVGENFLLQIIPKYSYSVYDDRSPESREMHSIKLDMEFYFRLN